MERLSTGIVSLLMKKSSGGMGYDHYGVGERIVENGDKSPLDEMYPDATDHDNFWR